MSQQAKPAPYQFHPLEISILGHSGVGKTTLITRLLEVLKPDWSLGYIKHDAHHFEVDRPGKDSFRAMASGAQSSFISNPEKFAWMAAGELPLLSRRSVFLEYDALIVEGFKALDLDKIVVLDPEHAVLKDIPPSQFQRIQAFVGAETTPRFPLPLDRPYFHRDELAAIAALLRGLWLAKVRGRPLRGLVLAGGLSRRMGQDKGLLHYRDRPQAIHAFEMLEQLGVSSLVSLRAEQWPLEARRNIPVLPDQFHHIGPMGGILSALHAEADTAWLVVACDLPLLRPAVLQDLLKRRDARKMATAFRSSSDGLPEPLCAVYEPKIRMRLHEALALGLSCPRKVLGVTDCVLLEPSDPQALTNVNTPDEFRAIQSHLFEEHAP